MQAASRWAEGAALERSLTASLHFSKPDLVDIAAAARATATGEPALLEDVFVAPPPDPYWCRANHVDGAWSI